MVDVFTKEKRSEVMARIRSKNTLVELTVFRFLRSKDVYFIKHYSKVPGKPDIAKPRDKKAVFIDGDFWHGRDIEKRRKTLPAKWQEKIDRNIERDKQNEKLLKGKGWKILRVWEYDLEKNEKAALWKIYKFLTS